MLIGSFSFSFSSGGTVSEFGTAGKETVVKIKIADDEFTAKGLMIHDKGCGNAPTPQSCLVTTNCAVTTGPL